MDSRGNGKSHVQACWVPGDLVSRCQHHNTCLHDSGSLLRHSSSTSRYTFHSKHKTSHFCDMDLVFPVFLAVSLALWRCKECWRLSMEMQNGLEFLFLRQKCPGFYRQSLFHDHVLDTVFGSYCCHSMGSYSYWSTCLFTPDPRGADSPSETSKWTVQAQGTTHDHHRGGDVCAVLVASSHPAFTHFLFY